MAEDLHNQRAKGIKFEDEPLRTKKIGEELDPSDATFHFETGS